MAPKNRRTLMRKSLIDLIVQTANKQGAHHHPVSVTALHSAYLDDNPSTTVGRSVASFAATLAFHCINMRARFPNGTDKSAQAPFLRRPLFKRESYGQYMLLSKEEIARFKACVAQGHPLVYQ